MNFSSIFSLDMGMRTIFYDSKFSEFAKFAKINTPELCKKMYFVKINPREMLEGSICENKYPRKLITAKIYAREN